jgi:hypothetical protein
MIVDAVGRFLLQLVRLLCQCRRRARGQGLNQTAAAQAFFDLFELKMRGHLSLTGEFRQNDSGDRVADCR